MWIHQKVQGSRAIGVCTQCNQEISVTLSQQEPALLIKNLPEQDSEMVADQPQDIFNSSGSQSESVAQAVTELVPKKKKGYLFGIREKMLILFFLIPIVLIAVSGYLYLVQLRSVSSLISVESTDIVANLAEDIIIQKAQDVAIAVKLYLDTHPEIPIDQLGYDAGFKKIAVQQVGKTGYTVVNYNPESGKWLAIAGPGIKLPNGQHNDFVNAEIIPFMKKILDPKAFKIFENMLMKAEKADKLVTGYHTFVDGKKFQAISPVDGYPFFVHATTFVNEFTQPMLNLQTRVNQITLNVQKIVLLIFAITAVLVAIIIIFYGTRLSNKIRKLTEVSDRISMGDMDVVIDSKDKDELGDLAESISRMQDSIRLSLSRLRRRRNR